jgi:hypothetical protein
MAAQVQKEPTGIKFLRANSCTEATKATAKTYLDLFGSTQFKLSDKSQKRTMLFEEGAMPHAGAAVRALLLDFLEAFSQPCAKRCGVLWQRG